MLEMTKPGAPFLMRKTYEQWKNCYTEWKVTYDEEDCQNIFINEKQTIDQLFSCMKYQTTLPMDKNRCNNLENSILYNFKGNITWDSFYKERDLDCLNKNSSNEVCR